MLVRFLISREQMRNFVHAACRSFGARLGRETIQRTARPANVLCRLPRGIQI